VANGTNLVTTYTYSPGGFDLAAITDPLNRTRLIYTDALGRPVTTTDPIGAIAAIAYDPLFGISQLAHSNGNLTHFGKLLNEGHR
jgi:hypothetical protein